MIANAITLLRIAAIVPLVYLLLGNDPTSQIAAAIVFVAAALLDALDGYVARKFNQITEWGKLWDPLADKLLVIAALTVLAAQGRAPLLAVLLIVFREVLITTLRLNRLGKMDIAAVKEGKLKAVLQMLSIFWLILGWPLADWILWAAVGLTLWSGYKYTFVYFKKDK